MVGSGAMPVPLAGGGMDGVPGADLDSFVSARLDASDPIDDMQRLPQRMGVPGIARAGAKRTTLTRMRDGSRPCAMTSSQTSPMNRSAPPFADGCFGWISNAVSFEPSNPSQVLDRGAASGSWVRAFESYRAAGSTPRYANQVSDSGCCHRLGRSHERLEPIRSLTPRRPTKAAYDPA
jgi:hypothetical protein